MNMNKPAVIIDGRNTFAAARKRVEQQRATRPDLQGKNTKPDGAA